MAAVRPVHRSRYPVRSPPARDQLPTEAALTTRFGVEDYTRRSTRVIARPADTREQSLLELPRHRPVLITESVNVDSAGRIIEYGVARFAADRVQLVLTP